MNLVNTTPHARAFDLPGWPCPPRVRDIPNHENSWGYVPCHAGQNATFANKAGCHRIVQDDLGYLWADGDAIPAFRVLDGDDDGPGAILAWTEQGLGVHVHPKSLRYIGNISKLDMEPDRWIPIATVLTEPPKEAQA
jgi:hypothetical protein